MDNVTFVRDRTGANNDDVESGNESSNDLTVEEEEMHEPSPSRSPRRLAKSGTQLKMEQEWGPDQSTQGSNDIIRPPTIDEGSEDESVDRPEQKVPLFNGKTDNCVQSYSDAESHDSEPEVDNDQRLLRVRDIDSEEGKSAATQDHSKASMGEDSQAMNYDEDKVCEAYRVFMLTTDLHTSRILHGHVRQCG